MRLVMALLVVAMLVPQAGCGRLLSAIFKSADNAAADAASRGGRSAGEHAIDAPPPRGGDLEPTNFGGDSYGVRLDGGSYWLIGTARHVPSYAVRATLRQYGYSSSGSEDIDEESRREIAAYRLNGYVSYTALTCWNSAGERYVVPGHATHCLDGSSPSLEYEIDLSVIPVQ